MCECICLCAGLGRSWLRELAFLAPVHYLVAGSVASGHEISCPARARMWHQAVVSPSQEARARSGGNAALNRNGSIYGSGGSRQA
jgi:hypothetical protein